MQGGLSASGVFEEADPNYDGLISEAEFVKIIGRRLAYEVSGKEGANTIVVGADTAGKLCASWTILAHLAELVRASVLYTYPAL